MHSKSAQISIFLVIGVILIAIAIFSSVVFFEDKKNSLDFEVSESDNSPTNTIKNYVDSCLEKTTKEAIFTTGLSGGYYKSLSYGLKIKELEVPVYLDKNGSYVPNISVIQDELEMYIEDNVKNCINNNSDIDVFNLELSNSVKSNVLLTDTVAASLELEVNYNFANTSGNINRFYSNLDFSYKKKLAAATKILDSHNSLNLIPESEILFIAKEKGFKYHQLDLDDRRIMHTLDFSNEDVFFMLNFIILYEEKENE